MYTICWVVCEEDVKTAWIIGFFKKRWSLELVDRFFVVSWARPSKSQKSFEKEILNLETLIFTVKANCCKLLRNHSLFMACFGIFAIFSNFFVKFRGWNIFFISYNSFSHFYLLFEWFFRFLLRVFYFFQIQNQVNYPVFMKK